MKIIILNGSPKGEYSITLQYLNYIQRKYSDHQFRVFHVSQKIKKIEKDEKAFNEIVEDVLDADLVLWSFGLWVLAVPAQYMRFIELLKEKNAESVFRNKYTAAISTSIQFYDHTAHNYIRAVCEDMGMQYIESASFYILDFMKEKKRDNLLLFFENILWTVNRKSSTSKFFSPLTFSDFKYRPVYPDNKINTSKKILIISDNSNEKSNLGRMIRRFSESFQIKPEVVDLNNIDIRGACLGCMQCGYDYNCHYKDGFKDFYNNQVRKADILILAGEMNGRYLSSRWKTFFDRAFFWNHTPSLINKQIAYIISGPISQNPNLMQILEGNVTARQLANLVDIVSDETADSSKIDAIIQRLAEKSVFYAERNFIRPENFLSVGGHKIFRDEIYGHLRGVWQADHRYYKKNGLYDFVQKKSGIRIMNFFLLLACKIPWFRKKYYANIKKFPAQRYGKLMDKLELQMN